MSTGIFDIRPSFLRHRTRFGNLLPIFVLMFAFAPALSCNTNAPPDTDTGNAPEDDAADPPPDPCAQVPLSATVSIPAGTSSPGCEETDECFLPATITVAVGGRVTWANDDTAAHTITSGSPADGPDGNFDSSLIFAGDSFSNQFDEPGTFPYFDLVHPWQVGTVIVEDCP